jgi:hypothetical protein
MFDPVHSNANLRRERPMTLHDHPALPADAASLAPLDDPRERAPSCRHRSIAARRLTPVGPDRGVVRTIFSPDTIGLYTALGLDPREPLVVDTGAPLPAACRLAAAA